MTRYWGLYIIHIDINHRSVFYYLRWVEETMKANASLHTDPNHAGLFNRIANDLSAALEWLAGPAMSEQERRERLMAEVQNLKHETSAIQTH